MVAGVKRLVLSAGQGAWHGLVTQGNSIMCCGGPLGADGEGFLYGRPWLRTKSERERWPPPPAPPVAEQDSLLPAFVSAYNPVTKRRNAFYVWQWIWATSRLGHDGNWYVLTYNSLDWGPWLGLRVYRHDLTSVRAHAHEYPAPPVGRERD